MSELTQLALEYERVYAITADCPCDPCIEATHDVLDQIIVLCLRMACIPTNRIGEVLPKTRVAIREAIVLERRR